MKGRSLLLLLMTWAGVAMALEEPAYQVVEATDDYEIRQYEPYLVAQTVVNGDFDSSGNRAFHILASYIFGNNTVGADAESVRMEMTAPVAFHESEVRDDAYDYWFVMER